MSTSTISTIFRDFLNSIERSFTSEEHKQLYREQFNLLRAELPTEEIILGSPPERVLSIVIIPSLQHVDQVHQTRYYNPMVASFAKALRSMFANSTNITLELKKRDIHPMPQKMTYTPNLHQGSSKYSVVTEKKTPKSTQKGKSPLVSKGPSIPGTNSKAETPLIFPNIEIILATFGKAPSVTYSKYCDIPNCTPCHRLFRRVNITRCSASCHEDVKCPGRNLGCYPHVGDGLWSMTKRFHKTGKLDRPIQVPKNNEYYCLDELEARREHNQIGNVLQVTDIKKRKLSSSSSLPSYASVASPGSSVASPGTTLWSEEMDQVDPLVTPSKRPVIPAAYIKTVGNAPYEDRVLEDSFQQFATITSSN